MIKIWNLVEKLKADVANEDGVTAIEYAVLAALIIVMVAAAVPVLQTGLSSAFTSIGAQLVAKVG